MTTKIKRREFLQLADTYSVKKHKIGGWYISEKLDGTRCLWDGGITRGIPTKDVPWASLTDPKTGGHKGKVKPVASGLWSRYGNPIMAPEWFLNQLPCCPLDGELWAGRGNFQQCRSICGGDTPDDRFDKIQYVVYSSPPMDCLFGTGQIKNTNMHLFVDTEEISRWVNKRLPEHFISVPAGSAFDQELAFLRTAIETQNDHVYMLQQIKLPAVDPELAANDFIGGVIERGGEGVILRDPTSTWTPKRHKAILKWKPYQDDEGIVTGFTSGRETDKGSKLRGMIGALILDYQGKRLELAGLTDEERAFADHMGEAYAYEHPGQDMPPGVTAKHFKRGDKVTFIYRELSDDGIPKEARYLRQRGEE